MKAVIIIRDPFELVIAIQYIKIIATNHNVLVHSCRRYFMGIGFDGKHHLLVLDVLLLK